MQSKEIISQAITKKVSTIIFLVFTLTIAALLKIFSALVIQNIVDNVLTKSARDNPSLAFWVGAFVVAGVLWFFTEMFNKTQSVSLGTHVTTSLSKSVYSAGMRADIGEIYDNFTLNCSVENDVNCFALAETINNKDSFLTITIGTGIGGAIIINNCIYHGINNSAGEFGQMIIENKKWEDLASMKNLVESAKELNLEIEDGVQLFSLYDNKDETAIKIIDEFYHYLAVGICNLAYIFNPNKIIIGGGITQRGKFIEELSSKIYTLKDDTYFGSTVIESSKYLNDGGLIGALVHHLKHKNKNGRY